MKLGTFTLVLALCASSSYAVSINKAGGCKIRLNDVVLPYLPLLLKPETTALGHDAFYLPEDRAGTITFAAGASVNLKCPGSTLVINNKVTQKTSATAKCSSGANFKVLGETTPLLSVKCANFPDVVTRYTGKACAKTYKEVEIGFQVDDGRFLKFVSICFDPREQHTIYSQFDLTKSINGFQVYYPRTDFLEGKGFYNLGRHKLNNLYTRYIQRVNINRQLGYAAEDFKYIHEKDDFYLARGHLTAKADFVYGSQHRGTFHYVNVAPQWQTFNAGNWNAIENNVRDYASRRKSDLVIYTGSYGVATLPHKKTGKQVPLYLYSEGTNKGIPVPKAYWKVAYEPKSKRGIAFVGINNPYAKIYTEDFFCKDVCNDLNWITVQVDNGTAGYVFCCDVKDFRKTITTLPTFATSGLLL